MKILDVFPYNNEIELLELRIKLLRGHVDGFIITEGNLTHSGEPREYRLRKDLDSLGINGDDITIAEARLPSKEEEPNNWARERAQRDWANFYFTPDDVAIVTDCDEIINPEYIKYYVNVARNHPNNILRLKMHYLNCRADLQVMDGDGHERFWGAGFISLHNHRQMYSLSQVREYFTRGAPYMPLSTIYATSNDAVETCGWHFSWMGNSDRMVTKFSNLADFGDKIVGSAGGDDNQKNLEHIAKYSAGEGRPDPLGRKDHILRKFDTALLPPLIFELPAVKNFLLPPKLPISLGILSWKSNASLRNTLKSYQDNGLLDMVTDVRIYFQEMTEADKLTANDFGIPYIGSADNVGICAAFNMLAAQAKGQYFIPLEHDWELVEDRATTENRLKACIEVIRVRDGKCVRLRHRHNYGYPLYGLYVHAFKELEENDPVTGLSSPHLFDCLHWRVNPEVDFPSQIRKRGDFYYTTSRWSPFTNNPCMYDTDFYLSVIRRFIRGSMLLEPSASRWWALADVTVAAGEGLFKHNDIDKHGLRKS